MTKELKLFKVNNQPVAATNIEEAIALYKMSGSPSGEVSDVHSENISIIVPANDELTNSTTTQKISEIEKETIRQTLIKYLGNRRKTAAALGMNERTFYRKLKEYELCNGD